MGALGVVVVVLGAVVVVLGAVVVVFGAVVVVFGAVVVAVVGANGPEADATGVGSCVATVTPAISNAARPVTSSGDLRRLGVPLSGCSRASIWVASGAAVITPI